VSSVGCICSLGSLLYYARPIQSQSLGVCEVRRSSSPAWLLRQRLRKLPGRCVEPLENEPPARIIIDPPLAESLSLPGGDSKKSHGKSAHRAGVQACHACRVSRVGHIHVTVDDAAWAWSDCERRAGYSQRPAIRPYKIQIQLESAKSISRSRHRQVHGACREAAAGSALAMSSDSAQDHKDNRC